MHMGGIIFINTNEDHVHLFRVWEQVTDNYSAVTHLKVKLSGASLFLAWQRSHHHQHNIVFVCSILSISHTYICSQFPSEWSMKLKKNKINWPTFITFSSPPYVVSLYNVFYIKVMSMGQPSCQLLYVVCSCYHITYSLPCM